MGGEEKERRDERQAQIQRVEAEILAHGLADTEEGVAAAEEVGGFTVHFLSFPLAAGIAPRRCRLHRKGRANFCSTPNFRAFALFHRLRRLHCWLYVLYSNIGRSSLW